MSVLKSVLVAFSMFSALPVPQIEWDRDSMRWALCAFPLVGACAALLCRLWLTLCAALALPELLRGAGLCLLPVFVTGGIHLHTVLFKAVLDAFDYQFFIIYHKYSAHPILSNRYLILYPFKCCAAYAAYIHYL